LLLGYHFLQREAYQDAGRFLRRVSLSGPYTREALLALGWVELHLRGAEAAMVPWMELLAYGRGDNLDEEAELAVAAAIASKGATRRVIEHYQRLLRQFEQEREEVERERLRHTTPYAVQRLPTLLQEEGERARNSVAAVALDRLLALRELLHGRDFPAAKRLDEGAFFDRLRPQLHTLYPGPDGQSGVGVVAYVARRTESYIHSSLQTSSRSLRPPSDLQQRIENDRATLDGEIAVVAEWYRRSRLAALQARDKRLLAYMERARLAIARSHDLALRRQERE
jgi:hypothetical protein